MSDEIKGIIGQERAKKKITTIFDVFIASKGRLRPHFLLTGSSGSGKTFMISKIAKASKINVITVNAAQITKEGTSGNSLSKVLSPLLSTDRELNIIYVDEFDKLFISGNDNDSSANEITLGVQNEFLKLLESATTEVYTDFGKYKTVHVSKCLYVFSGAFNGEQGMTTDRLRSIGVKTEFLGRIRCIVETDQMTEEMLLNILNTTPLLTDFVELYDEISKEKAIEDIAPYVKKFAPKNDMGARLVEKLIYQYFIDGEIDADMIEKQLFNEAEASKSRLTMNRRPDVESF